MSIALRVIDRSNVVLSEASGDSETWLFHQLPYNSGDRIEISCGLEGCFIVTRLDDAMAPALCYLKSGQAVFEVPFGEVRSSYSPLAFSGDKHCLSVRIATAGEIAAYRNVAFNPYDGPSNTALFPRAWATAETPGISAFAARCAIDGEKANWSHGAWPFTSWGINRDPTACLTIDFGREVVVERAAIYLRADFPHDSWWTSAILRLSDGSERTVALQKTGAAQVVDLAQERTSWIKVFALEKADDVSPFPALTQLEIWGADPL